MSDFIHWHDFKWEEISNDRFNELLGAVPPAKYFPGGFAVGEALYHDDAGRAVYQLCREVGGKHFATEGTITAIDERFGVGRAQMAIPAFRD
jgi:hypothetical protein